MVERDGVEYVTLREHLEALGTERDRRYAEVNVEKEKALKIKETADLAALQLAREIQTYKDEKANELREQINQERNLYVTKSDLQGLADKMDALMKPLTEFMVSQRGGVDQRNTSRLDTGQIIAWIALLGVLVNTAILVFKG